MGYLSDIEIAQSTKLEHISRIAEKAGIPEEYVEQYGRYKAKIDPEFLKKADGPDGKLVL
ncbi:MAG: formate--tetrahydrofolate ligase, partial [Clostridia bacterium]|nr:formate--tetrahydrofolate ligase [Clostridia bacterium]